MLYVRFVIKENFCDRTENSVDTCSWNKIWGALWYTITIPSDVRAEMEELLCTK